MRSMGLIYIALLVLVVGSWIGNMVKLTKCDFETPLKCEMVHAIGIIPIASVVTVWFDMEETPDVNSDG